ncbi:MAG: hypothetical protein DDG59_09810 [Anaerolineae bacterium]|jgi:hypothetical protein|nr:MAG: hypothetical protein DDG59_09810 [Anaerolineae bacterium]
MKTQILQLETHDDLISILDKIGWTQTERVLLVLPRRRRILNHKLDLLRLKRHSSQRGCQIAIVTTDSLVKTLAKEVNIPTFHSIQKANQVDWPTSFEPKDRFSPNNDNDFKRQPLEAQKAALQASRANPSTNALPLWARLAWFSLAILAVMSIVGVLAPSATIRITPPVQQQSLTIPILVTRRVQQTRISGELPISTLKVTVSGQKTLKTSGSVTIPKDFAVGEVILTNLTDQPLEVPAGTPVRTLDPTPRRYVTQQTVLLTPTGDEKSATVAVQAIENGASFNIPPNAIKAVEGLLGLKISVTNPQPIQGGSNLIASAPSQQDRQLLFRQLQAELLEKAKDQIRNDLPEGALLLPDSAVQIQVLRQQYTPEEIIPSDRLSLDLEIAVSFGVVNRQSILDLGDQIFASSLPVGYQPMRETFIAYCQTPLTPTNSGDYTCNLEISRKVQQTIDAEEVRRLVISKPIAIASQSLQQSYHLTEPPRIEMKPNWFPILPLLPMRIDIVIEK